MARATNAMRFYLVFLLALTLPQCILSVPQAQIEALNDLYDATNGDSWTNNTNWKVGDPCVDSWFGVYCSGDNVNHLSLSYNGLTGTIPSSIGNINTLALLFMHDNKLYGTIPASLWTIGSLSQLDVHSNQLSGTILSPTVTLQLMNLAFNQFSGPFPELPGPSFNILNISNNNFAGALPQSFLQTYFSILDLSYNQLSGYFAPNQNWNSLTQINLRNNNFTGDIALLTMSPFLKFVDLSNNSFNGTISVVHNTFMTDFIVANNKINGTIPWSFTFLDFLTNVDLSGNQLTGTIPGPLGSYYQYINVSRNALSGPLYSSRDLNSAITMDFSHNKFSGTIPEYFSENTKLLALHLDHNKLTGTIPPSISNLKALKTLTLQNNLFNGTLPTIYQTDPGYNVFNAKDNAFSCPLPQWCSAPPTGNGECSPCSSPGDSLFCCGYSADGCKTLSQHFCEVNSCTAPPSGSALKLCVKVPTSSCKFCSSGSLVDQFGGFNPGGIERPSGSVNFN